MTAVAHFVEQLHFNMSSPQEKELVTTRLLAMIRAKKDVRVLIGTHSQAMPLFISVLRTGTTAARVNIASALSALCREEELRVKVLLGGCIPPLLSLLKSEPLEARKAAAEAIYEVSSGGLSEDHIGMKILVTEGVVPTLWDQLNPKMKQDKVVEGFVTGALRNLCGDKDGYWRATLEAGGVEIISGLLSCGNGFSQSNAASLLARLVSAFGDSVSEVVNASTVGELLHLLSKENEVSVRASAADALEALSLKSSKAKKTMVEGNGIPALIGAVVAPSKECMRGEACHSLQRHAVRALANICGGMSSLVSYLGEISRSPHLAAAPVGDIIGALAYSLMVFEEAEKLPNISLVEEILIQLLKPRESSRLVHDRVLEALASLYGNNLFSQRLLHADAKRMLIGLITMASVDLQEHLIQSLTRLCSGSTGIWESIGDREGVQMLISLLGLSGEQLQEYTVALLAILTDHVDECKWAITAAGGIPPLVHLLETGSSKARENAANVLWNLCCYSDDIRACVESAGAVSALLWLLKSGTLKGQEAASKALKKLIRAADSATINQLLALLLGEAPSSKAHVIMVLSHVLVMASRGDLVQKGSPANKALRSLVEILNSSDEETQECVACVLADLFSTRQDICDSLATDEIVHPCMKLLTSKTQMIATQSARALGALSRQTNSHKVSYIAGGDVQPLINLAKSSSVDAAETAVAALANLLSDPQIAREALVEDIVPALTRMLNEGSAEGKVNASRAFLHLLNQYPIGEVLVESSRCRFMVLSLFDSLALLDLEGVEHSDPLDLLSLLVRTKQNASFSFAPWSDIAEAPGSLEPLIHGLVTGLPPVQDRAIEILSRLCLEQPVLLGDLLIGKAGSLGTLAERVMSSPSLEVRVGGTSMLICAAREQRQLFLDALEEAGFLKPLVFSLADMVKQPSPSSGSTEIARTSSGSFMEKRSTQEDGESERSDPASILGSTVALWLLCLISSSHDRSRRTFMEAGGVDLLCDELSSLCTADTQVIQYSSC